MILLPKFMEFELVFQSKEIHMASVLPRALLIFFFSYDSRIKLTPCPKNIAEVKSLIAISFAIFQMFRVSYRSKHVSLHVQN